MLLPDNLVLLVLLSAALTLSFTSLVMAYICFCRLRNQASLTSKLYQQLEKNLKLVSSSTIGMGKKIVAVEKELSAKEAELLAVKEQPSSRVNTQSASVDNDMNDAIMLLNAGVEPQEVARRCGISRAEASLMKLMHAQADRVSAA